MRQLWIVLTLIVGVSSATAEERSPFEFEFEKLAEGVWAGVRPDGPRFPVMGSVTFVIGDTGVVVFDGGGMPAMAEQTMEKIGSLTDKPVTHVIISHWHGDHSFGIWRYLEEYPNVQVVTHDFTDRAQRGSNVDYIRNYAVFETEQVPRFKEMVETGKDSAGNDLPEGTIGQLQGIIDAAPVLAPELVRAKLTQATVAFEGTLVIYSGGRRIELHHLGHGNTEGDIVMWLPEEKVLAAGDLVVLPSPYAFNMPPTAWVETLKELNGLDYETLVPGHGPVQRDTTYVDLLIDVGTDIANQRDKMVEEGVATEEIAEKLDFSSWEEKFTGGDPYIKGYYHAWFEGPFRAAAVKELSGEPMVVIGPSTLGDE